MNWATKYFGVFFIQRQRLVAPEMGKHESIGVDSWWLSTIYTADADISLDKSEKNRNNWYDVLTRILRGLTTTALHPADLAKLIKWKFYKRISMKSLIFRACILLAFVFIVKLNYDTHNTHELDSAENPVFPCERSPKEANELLELFHDVHEILNEMNIRHFLIYGSIWGAYRTKGPLPWDYDIDIAIIGDENYARMPKSDFVKPFRKRGITVKDMTTISSCFYFTRGEFAQVDIDIFYNYNGWMQRTGLLTWLLYYNYQTYHRFPAWMVEQPLPKMQFADLEMAVPHGGRTILKYLYPNDWESPFTPTACLVNKEGGKNGQKL